MKHAASITIIAAALAFATSSFAQMASPMPTAPQDRTTKSQSARPYQAPEAVIENPGARDGLGSGDRVPRDRFGNIVRGNNCSDHWANCAYDPSNPMPQQQGRLPNN